ncbi:MAG TPA: HD domain-containing phosphohydrolase [Rhodocyclaceae bacterium]|nr:HD domain-containing phosphohydrolase [Rhodocyclaceae bacterium]
MNLPNETDRSTDRPTILTVDDVPENLAVLHHILSDRYRVRMANSGARALEIMDTGMLPDLVLLDVAMPEMDGYAVCRAMQAHPAMSSVPVIFVTANATDSDEHIGLSCGAVDYIAKPFNPQLLRARIKNHLALKHMADRLKSRGDELEKEVAVRTRDLVNARDATILAMASLAETRDNETGNHIKRTLLYVRALAEGLSTQPEYATLLTPDYIELLSKSAPLHDIGKIGVADAILRKPGKLTPEEFEIMKRHTEYGRAAIEKAEETLGMPIESLRVAKEIAYSHHEKWDGSGYPLGLKGCDIPLSARLMAVADVYDAVISRRCYKPAMAHDDAAKIIRTGAGKHFDPAIVAAFERQEERLFTIARQNCYEEPQHMVAEV